MRVQQRQGRMEGKMALQPTIQAKAKRALERRFGVSTMPYDFKCVRADTPVKLWRITDIESGSWIDFVYRNGKLEVRREFDAA